MKNVVASVLKRSTLLLLVMLVFVCARAEAQCSREMLNDYPDPEAFLQCMSVVYGPPTQIDMILYETILETPSIYEYLANGPFNQWSWEGFYGCWTLVVAGSGFGNLVVWLGGAPVTAAGFVGTTAGGALGCFLGQIDWYW